MEFEELEKLVAGGESEHLEFKKSTGQRTQAAKTVCAFLNGIHGCVLFGVTDEGEIVGQQVTTKTLADIAHELQRIEPPVFPEIETIPIENNKAVIAVRVSGKVGVYCYDGRPFIRHGPLTQIMPQAEYERRILRKFHDHQRWENEFTPKWVTIQDLDEDEVQLTLENAVKLGRMKQPVHTDTASILRGLGLLKGGRLINAAVALYGKGERLFSSYPQLTIKLARFRGATRLTGFMDNREYWGNAFDLLQRGEVFLLDRVPIAGRLVPGKMVREDYPLYPPLATREAIANAICHRDYTDPGVVAIAMYDDKLEVINPGAFHFDITPEYLMRPHESKPWNPIIANVFYRAGIIEQWGMGTLNIIEWCKSNDNPDPTWQVRAQSVVTTFFPSTFFATGERRDDVKPASFSEVKLGSLEDGVLSLLQYGALSKSEIAKHLGHRHISGGLKKVLSRLLAQRKISFSNPAKPNSRMQKYIINHTHTRALFGELRFLAEEEDKVDPR